MFTLDFISWLISWQRGLYAENNFFKKCPFLAFWASSFGTKFVLLEAYTWSKMIYLRNWSSKEEYVVWPVNTHVNCQVKDIELPRSHHTMLAISIAHLRMTWSTLFGRGQGEGWKQNFYSVESLWFSRSIPVMFWIHLCDVKICRVQRCNIERVKKKELETFLLHCWNCTFAPPNFLNLFSGSVWLWKFAGCKGAMLKG